MGNRQVYKQLLGGHVITDFTETAKEKDRAILVAVENEESGISAEKSLEELASLAETSGCETVCTVIQKREKPHPAHYVGKGKLQELKTLASETGATVLIADDELSPTQLRVLGGELNISVIDRTVLILDIFASRAASREGKIQVELAQQRYRLAHLSGLGQALSRLGGGIGTRGPGEKKLETDKRHIRRAIANLTEELEEIECHRTLLRKSAERKGLPTVSLAGYTNAGKSTLLNALTNAGVLADNMLFATLDTTTRKLTLPEGGAVLLSDTVGFISKLPHQLVKAFRATLDELSYADILLHVIDVSDSEYKQRMEVVERVLTELGCAGTPRISVYNKIDLCRDEPPQAGIGVYLSAKSNEGTTTLLKAIEDILKGMRKRATFLIPYQDGGLIGLLHGKCEIVSEEHTANGVLIEAYVPPEVCGVLRKYAVK